MEMMQTPAPQAMRVDLTDYSLLVQDLSKPVWHGPYHDGTLSIYEVQVETNSTTPADYTSVFAASVTYLCVFVEVNLGNNFITYGHYVRGTPVEAICEHLQATVYDTYLAQLAEKKQSSYVPGNSTIN